MQSASMNQQQSATLSGSKEEKKRLRISRACEFCRRRKVKCHFTPGSPCANCVSYRIACEFTNDAKKRGPPKGYIEALENRIRTIEDILTNSLEKQDASPLSTSTHRSEPSSSSIPLKRPSSPSSQTSGAASSKRSTDMHETRMKKQPRGASSDRVRYLGDLSALQFLKDKISIEGGSEKMFLGGQKIKRFGQEIVLMEDNDETEDPAPFWFTDSLSPGRSIHHWIYSVSGVDRHTSDRLLKIYFANIHPVLPVVNKEEFLRQYRDQVDTYPAADLLNAMFGAAARFVECEAQRHRHKPFTPPDVVWDVPKNWSEHFFEQSQTISKFSQKSSISKVQSFILAHNTSGNMDSKSSACWLMGGVAVRLAQGLGLNRNCDEWDIPESEKLTRKRIWWSLYVTDRFQSASLGRPISIHDEDNDVGYPDPSASWREVLDEPEDLDGDDVSPRFPSATYRPASLEGRVEIYQLFIQLIKLSEILGRILQGLYTPKARKLSYEHGSDAIVTRLDHELTEWRFAFPKELQRANFDDFNEKGYFSPTVASILLCYFSSLILLHRPFIERAQSAGKNKARPSYLSFRISSSAATRGIRIAEHMTARDFIMFPYCFSLYPILQFCLIHIYNTRNPDGRISAPAKADLTKAVGLVERLYEVSNNARLLHGLLRLVMDNLGIVVSETESQQEQKPSKETTCRWTKLSDVGRNPPQQPGDMSWDDQVPSSFIPLVPEPTSMEHPSAIQTSTASPTAGACEAYSLKQFGFDTPSDPSPLDHILQDVSDIIGSNSYPMFQQQQHYTSSQAPTPIMPLDYNTFGAPVLFTSGGSSTSNEGQFRHNPENPFWNIPSSMDWTEWTEWNQRTQSSSPFQQQ